METTPKQQTIELINKAKNILITAHKNFDGDALGSVLALQVALKELDKNVSIVAPGELNPIFSFLTDISTINNNLASSKDFVITIDTLDNTNGEIKLGYKNDRENHKLSIIISSTKGVIDPKKVELGSGRNEIDLIIVLDTPDIEMLGSLYDDNSELFYESPIINIDHHATNDYYGKVNWVELTATSTCEILVSLIESLSGQHEKKLLQEPVATYLLTGIITDTGSFQNGNTTPKSFTVAAQLVSAGARQQEIIKNIFKTKSLPTLHVWGAVLSNIVQESNPDFVWSWVDKDTIKKVGATSSSISGVIDELLKNAPGMEFALLLSEREDTLGNSILHGSIRSISPSLNATELASAFGGGGHTKAAGFEQPRSGKLQDQLEEVIVAIKTKYQELKPSSK